MSSPFQFVKFVLLVLENSQEGKVARKNNQTESILEQQYLDIIRAVPDYVPMRNSSLLLEQPENVVGQNFTTYSAGEVPAFVQLKQL